MKNYYNIHRKKESHLRTTADGMVVENDLVKLYIGEGYTRKIVGVYNLKNITGVRQITPWKKVNNTKVKKKPKKTKNKKKFNKKIKKLLKKILKKNNYK